MNHRTLFLLSLLIIAIGVSGLLLNQSTSNDEQPLAAADKEEKPVLLAVASRPLVAGSLLTTEDFRVKTLAATKDSELAGYDVTPFKSLVGHLITANIEKDSYIAPALIEAPDSPTFLRHSLKTGEIAWKFDVDATNVWLLDSLLAGDQVALYLRTLESSKNKKLKDTVGLEAKEMSSSKNQQYVLTPVLNKMTVLRVHRYPSDDEDSQESRNNKGFAGYVQLKMNSQDIRKIEVITKAGDLLLMPASGDTRQIGLDQILPNLPKFKELRG